MGIFNIFKKNDENDGRIKKNKDNENKNIKLQIAKIISSNDKNVMGKVLDCVSNPERYFEENKEKYEERAIFEIKDKNTIEWIGMVDIFEDYNYVSERDWKDESEDFVYAVNSLNQAKNNYLVLEEEWFDDSEDIPVWSKIADDKWKDREMCIGCIDIDSDSYVLFICKVSDLEKLKVFANKINQRIDFAKNM